ncbi:hypothetical protein KAR91_24570 [Candidatus Pacearchaeota archaeon]|nr:hypothetical protein [Candidatus Pacearchaeota archaeon]
MKQLLMIMALLLVSALAFSGSIDVEAEISVKESSETTKIEQEDVELYLWAELSQPITGPLSFLAESEMSVSPLGDVTPKPLDFDIEIGLGLEVGPGNFELKYGINFPDALNKPVEPITRLSLFYEKGFSW